MTDAWDASLAAVWDTGIPRTGGMMLTTFPCPCIYPDLNPELGEDTCECGHVLDEHDDDGQCTITIDA